MLNDNEQYRLYLNPLQAAYTIAWLLRRVERLEQQIKREQCRNRLVGKTSVS